MHKQTPNSHKETRQPHEPVERVLYRLRELHQIQDESRNELCPVFSDEDSHIRASRGQSSYSQHPHVLKDLEQTEGVESRQRMDSQRNSILGNFEELRTANLRLREDNVKLFHECIKLKKQLQLYEAEVSGFHRRVEEDETQRVPDQQEQLDKANKALQKINKELQVLTDDNRSLERQLDLQRKKGAAQKQELKEWRLKVLELDRLSQELRATQKNGQELRVRVCELERELEEEQRKASKSTSLNSFSQEGKKESDKDRMISNLKLVHESEVRRLKGVIEQLRKETSSRVLS